MSRTDPDNIPHPNHMSEDDLKALRESDPSAFDDDVTPPESKEENEDDVEKKDDKAPVEIEKKEDEPADDTPAKSSMIPKARFDEVNNQKKALEDALAVREAEIEALRTATAPKVEAVAERDFDAEFAELEQKYDDSDITHEDYKKAQLELRKEEREYTKQSAALLAVQAIKQEQQLQAQAIVEKNWNDANKAWLAENQEFLKAPGARDAMQTAIDFVDKQNAGNPLSPADMLAKAHEIAAKMIGVESKEPKQPARKEETARERSHREARERAERAPAAFQGGMGDRGANPSKVDVSNMKPGTFSSLSKADQEKLLGEGAL